MVLQTKLVDTNSLTDLCKQLLEVRKTDLSDEKLVTSLKSWIKKLDGEKDQEKHKTCFKSMCIGLFTHLIENKNVELTILEVSDISVRAYLRLKFCRSFTNAMKNHRRRDQMMNHSGLTLSPTSLFLSCQQHQLM